MKQEPTPRTSPLPAKIIGERSTLLARRLGLSGRQFEKIADKLIQSRRLAPLDRIDADGVALLLLTALLRPEPRATLHIADALLNTSPRLEAEGAGPFVASDPQSWAAFPNAISVLAACLTPASLLDQVSVGIEKLNGAPVISVVFIAGEFRLIWGAELDDTRFSDSGLVNFCAALGGEAAAEIATAFRLKFIDPEIRRYN